MIFKKIVGIIVLIYLSGCAQTMLLKPSVIGEQESIYDDGVQTIVSNKTNIVAMRPESTSYKSNERPRFVISFNNRTEDPINFSTENISAMVGSEQLEVLSYEKLKAEVESKAKLAAFLTALSGALQSVSAGQSAGNTYYQDGRYSYNPYAAQAAQNQVNARTQSQLAQIEQQSQQALGQLGKEILKKTTVMPSQWHGGYIEIKNPFGKIKSPIEMFVTISDEVHHFRIGNIKAKRSNDPPIDLNAID